MIVAGNRDELHSRPTSPLSRWTTPDHLLAGRDLQSGGTWLGISDRGRFAVVTNLGGFGAPRADRSSRGALVTDALSDDKGFADFHDADFLNFNPFNLIMANRVQAQFLTNRPNISHHLLTPGIYGLSNGALDEPWPKTVRLKETLGSWILKADADPQFLLDALRDEGSPGAGIRSAEPSALQSDPQLSSIFIRNPVYGTRCSTVAAVDERGKGVIIERRYSAEGTTIGETALSFTWSD